MAKSTTDLNLLPNKGEGLVTQFLNWSLTVGRLLILLTETLALGVFVYRFSLDMKIVDLHDQIKQSSAIVKYSGSNEDKFRNLQKRLVLAKTYDKQSSVVPTIFHDIVEIGRGHVTFRSLLVQSDMARIEAQAPSSGSLSYFVQQLKKYSAVRSISIDKVENKTSSALVTVGITAYLKTNNQTPSKQ